MPHQSNSSSSYDEVSVGEFPGEDISIHFEYATCALAVSCSCTPSSSSTAFMACRLLIVLMEVFIISGLCHYDTSEALQSGWFNGGIVMRICVDSGDCVLNE